MLSRIVSKNELFYYHSLKNTSKYMIKYSKNIRLFHLIITKTILYPNTFQIEPRLYSLKNNMSSVGNKHSITENEFHILADKFLDNLLVKLDLFESNSDLEDIDITLSQGVMTIKLGNDIGTWVINKQTPNRQIWWSSPISGPKRYEYNEKQKKWINTRDNGDLIELLRAEIKNCTGITI